MAYGSIYPVTWWGNTNEANGWGIVYPVTASGSNFTADTALYTADTTIYKADATEI